MTGLNPTDFQTVQAWSVVAPETMTKVPDAYAQWNDFSALGGSVGIANRQASIDLLDEQRLEEIQAEKDKDTQGIGTDFALAAMEEAQERRLERINGDTFRYGDYEFETQDVLAALNENMEKYKRGLSPDEAARLDEVKVLLASGNLTDEQKHELIKEAIEINPDIVEDADQNHYERQQIEPNTTNEITDAQRSYAEEALNDGPPQQVAHLETNEGFSLDEPALAVPEAKPFSLDM